MKYQQKIDEAIAAAVFERRLYGRQELREGDELELDVRMGDEGEGSWTRFHALRVEARHLRMADAMEEEAK